MNLKLVLAFSPFALTSFVGSAQGIPPGSAESSQPNSSHDKRTAVSVKANYGKLPLSFEANHGQSDPQVKFLSHGNGYSLFLTDSAAVLALTKSDPASNESPNKLTAGTTRPARIAKPAKTDVIRMELAGASHGLLVAGADQLPGTANYFIGNDPKKWQANVPTYAKVRYSSVYPGIDLVYYGNQRRLEYDFVVAPGADPERAKLHFAGAKKLKLNADGDLEVIAKDGEIAFHKPVVYQEVNGQRHSVDGQFTLLAKNTIGFSLGKYDRDRAVVIDPTLAYSTYLGGSANSAIRAIAVDSSGYAYATGLTSDSDFPTQTPYQSSLNNHGASVAFVSKLTPAGDALVYSTYLGGTTGACTNVLEAIGDSGNGIAVDNSGNAYVTGTVCSTNFPLMGAYQSTNNGGQFNSNAFITKLNATGTAPVYSTYLGGTGSVFSGDFGEAIAVDSAGNAYVTGLGYSGGHYPPPGAALPFPTTIGAYQTVNKSNSVGSDPFVTKLSPDGSTLVFSTLIGGDSGTSANAIAVDSQGEVFVTGTTLSIDFPATSGAYQTTNHESVSPGLTGNAYVVKLAPSGSSVIYATYLGGSSFPNTLLQGDIGLGIAVDTAGSAYIAGATYSHDFPLEAAYQTTNNVLVGHPNGFVAKFSPDGSSLIYSTYLGGNLDGGVDNIKIDPLDDAYVSGYTFATNFPVTADAYQPSNNGNFVLDDVPHVNYNAFLSEFNPSGSALVYSTYFGGKGDQSGDLTGDQAIALARDPAGNVYLAGYTQSSDFPVTPGSFKTTDPAPSGTSGFVSKFLFAGSTSSGLQFVPVTPCRVADTRNPTGPFGGPEPTAGSTTTFDVPQSACNIPSGAVAYSLNVTVVPNASLNYLTLWPGGQAQPFVSTLNSDGRVKANAAIIPAGTNGGVSVFVTDPTQVILDIDGYFVPAGTSSALAFYPVTPCRVADTRQAAGPLGGPFIPAGGSRAFPVLSGSCNLPSTAQAYSLNVTAVPHTTLNYLTIWPTGETQPNVSTLNSSTGAVTANAAIVPAGGGGDLSVFVYDDADVILDVNGYFAPPATGGLSLYAVSPCRAIDTRPVAFAGTLAVGVEQGACAPPLTAQAYVLNATVVPPGALNYLTLWPDGQTQPYVSTLNADDGAITSNMAIVPTTNGIIDAFAYNPTNLILDLSGYFAP
jgi:Beta-propeller repeat